MMDSLWNGFGAINYIISGISSQFLRNVPIIERMILTDGLLNAMVFSKEYLIHKVSERKIVKARLNFESGSLSQKEIVEKCGGLYTLPVLDRYLVYFVMVMSSKMLFTVSQIVWKDCLSNERVFDICLMCFTIPYIQNMIMRVSILDKLQRKFQIRKQVFGKYFISKLIVKWVGRLDESIDEIKNYHIFVLYKHVTIRYFVECIKSYCFISFLHFLRNNESTYYYYKAIKFSYYYNSGYLFNIMSRDDAVRVMNIVIHEKKWKDIYRVDIVNAIYSLVNENSRGIFEIVMLNIYMYKFFALWSGICLLKLLDKTSFINISLYIMMMCIVWSKSNRRLKHYSILALVYALILLNANDIIISLLVFFNGMLYYIIEEIYFFTGNYDDILKIVNYNDHKSNNDHNDNDSFRDNFKKRN